MIWSVIGHADFDESPDFILTEDINGVNLGDFSYAISFFMIVTFGITNTAIVSFFFFFFLLKKIFIFNSNKLIT